MTMKNSKEKQDVGLFTLISFLYSWPIFFVVDAWLVPLFIQQDNLGTARLVLIFGHFLGMLGPAIAAFLMWRVFHRGSQPAWRWSKPKYYLGVVAFMVAFWCLPGVVGLAFGDTFDLPIETHRWIMIVSMLTLGWISGMGEEIGWSAYLLPRLSPKIGKARAMMVSGIIRGLWHWPVLVGPVISKTLSGDGSLPQLIVFSVIVAFQLAISNIFFGSVFGWVWNRTKSMPLVGWLHQWYDLARDATILLLVAYGNSLWASSLNVAVFSGLGCWLLIRIGKKEGTSLNTLFHPIVQSDSALSTDYLNSLQAQAVAEGKECVVGGLILNHQNAVFVQKRSSDRALFPGCWDIAGGHVETKETLLQALVREIQEETGWQVIRVIAHLKTFDWEQEKDEKMIKKREFDFLVEVKGNLKLPKIGKEKFSEYRWIQEDELATLHENRADDDSIIIELVQKALSWNKEKVT